MGQFQCQRWQRQLWLSPQPSSSQSGHELLCPPQCHSPEARAPSLLPANARPPSSSSFLLLWTTQSLQRVGLTVSLRLGLPLGEVRRPANLRLSLREVFVLKLEVSYESFGLLHSLGAPSEQGMPTLSEQGSHKAATCPLGLRFPRALASGSPVRKCHCPVTFVVAERTTNSERGPFQNMAPRQAAEPAPELR